MPYMQFRIRRRKIYRRIWGSFDAVEVHQNVTTVKCTNMNIFTAIGVDGFIKE